MDRRLRRAVLERLAAVEEMAVQNLPVRVARTQLKIITDGWRGLLLEHQPDPRGRCPVCSGWLRRRRWPCPVWVTAHQHLIGDGSEPMEHPSNKSHQLPHPRQVEVIPRQVGTTSATEQISAEQISAASVPGESRDHCEPTTVPIVPIHRAAVRQRQPAMPHLRPGQRSRT